MDLFSWNGKLRQTLQRKLQYPQKVYLNVNQLFELNKIK